MDTNALKKFAQAARNLLIDQVTAKLSVVIDPASAARRENPDAMKKLDAAIARIGKQQVIEQVAYTWFNRFTALRFMDVNGYTNPRVVSPEGNATRPEILAEAMAGNLPQGAPATIAALLDGRSPSRDPQGEAYRLLLVHACNAWHKLMPFLFEKVGDYTELLMPEDLLSPTSILARLREAMPEDDCKDVEIIGWLYQFYISEKKDEVFAGLKKNKKIEAENIPAATQLFTPHWIVRYLVENSLGRLWMLNHPQSTLTDKMDYYIAPVEPETDFLRVSSPEEIKINDPACGSGHMLTYAFDLLYAIYEEQGYDPSEIPALILTNNLFGIEIDERAGALAAFALTMKARGKQRRFFRKSVRPNICVLQNVRFADQELEEYTEKVGRDLFTSDLRETLGQFAEAKNFGSLIVPALKDVDEVARVVEAQDFAGNLFLNDTHSRVQRVLHMAEYLSPKYHVVVANPPYMGGKGMNARLKAWAGKNYPDSKSDLFAMFMERALEMSVPNGMMAMINMQSWMFLSSFEKLRSKLLGNATLLSMAHLGERGFDTIGGAVVSTTAFVFANAHHPDHKGDYLRLVDGGNEDEKAKMAIGAIRNPDCGWFYRASAEDFSKIPGSPLTYWVGDCWFQVFSGSVPIGEVSYASEGIKTGNNEKYLRYWFEVANLDVGPLSENNFKWVYHIKGGEFRRWAGNEEYVILWQDNGEEIRMQGNSGIQGERSFPRNSAIWSDITTGGYSARLKATNHLFDSSSPSGFIIEDDKQYDLLAFLNSKIVNEITPMLNPTLHFKVGNFRSLPYRQITNPKAEGLIDLAKSDWDAFETSWDFTTLPLLEVASDQWPVASENKLATNHYPLTTRLEEAYTTLRARWQQMTDEMQRLEQENNRIFIDAYGLQDELKPDVPLEEITLTCNPAYRYRGNDDLEGKLCADTMREFLSYAVGCMFGRYSLDAPGLILANQGETLQDYLARVPEPSFMPDEDNVIPVLNADWFPDDIVDRFRKFLRVTFGEAHFRENLKFIEDALGKDIRKYFTKDFYTDHVKRYKKRPIYWMFSSPKGTFQALIYMHRYRPDTVSVLLNDYLREFIRKLEAERGRLEKLADDSSATQTQRTRALKDVATVTKQIAELEEWERDVIFPLAQQKIEIDLDDGVKANYPKFGAALKKIAGVS